MRQEPGRAKMSQVVAIVFMLAIGLQGAYGLQDYNCSDMIDPVEMHSSWGLEPYLDVALMHLIGEII
jgi:hypothetical protein